MATTVTATPHDVQTTLNYYSPIGTEAPFRYVNDPPEGKEKHNVGQDVRPVVIYDVRGKEEEYGHSLDTSGFQFVKHESAVKDFEDEDAISSVYYKEVEDLLKREAGAKRVFIFDHTIRRGPNYKAAPGKTIRGPGLGVHIDQTYEASVARVHYHLGEEAESLLKGRVRIINVWRPIGNTVAHHPLAVSDWRSLDTEHDLVPVQLIYPSRVGGIYNVKYNPNHRWYYLADQTPEEVTLIKCYDSEVDRARLTPHTAFHDASTPPEAPPRESIEVRCLVFDSE